MKSHGCIADQHLIADCPPKCAAKGTLALGFHVAPSAAPATAAAASPAQQGSSKPAWPTEATRAATYLVTAPPAPGALDEPFTFVQPPAPSNAMIVDPASTEPWTQNHPWHGQSLPQQATPSSSPQAGNWDSCAPVVIQQQAAAVSNDDGLLICGQYCTCQSTGCGFPTNIKCCIKCRRCIQY